jgi:glycosyltransferase involved in cell wall biosynthesis
MQNFATTRGGVSIIIPTTCEAKRCESIVRAIRSVTVAPDEAVSIIVVVNGERFDPALLATLKGDPRLQVIYEPIGSLPLALCIGRSAVQTEYFGFLDDDDEYLSGAITIRRKYLEANPGADIIVSNGVRSIGDEDVPFLTGFAEFGQDPLHALLRVNWLASCGAMYRSQRIGREFFDSRFKYLEWTLLAFKIAASRNVGFIDQPTFRINDTADSLSKSEAYTIAYPQVLAEILRLSLPITARKAIRRKLSSAHHTLADHYLGIGQRAQAWRHHLASLALPGGIRYFSFTRRLL